MMMVVTVRYCLSVNHNFTLQYFSVHIFYLTTFSHVYIAAAYAI